MAKLTFQRLNLTKEALDEEPFEVAYNPAEVSFTKAAQFADINVPGLDSPVIQFVRGEAEALSLELFFDSTQNGTGVGADSVVPQVDKFYRLVKIEGELHTPPIVNVSWGETFPADTTDRRGGMDCIVTSCERRFTLFSTEGVPLRAVVTLQLREYRTVEEQLQAMNLQSSDHTRTVVVREGDTLPLIAFEAYNNPARWRIIAEHNRLRDVRRLVPGTVLLLPPTT